MNDQQHELADNIFICDSETIFMCKSNNLKEYLDEYTHTNNKKRLNIKWNEIQAFLPDSGFQLLFTVQSKMSKALSKIIEKKNLAKKSESIPHKKGLMKKGEKVLLTFLGDINNEMEKSLFEKLKKEDEAKNKEKEQKKVLKAEKKKIKKRRQKEKRRERMDSISSEKSEKKQGDEEEENAEEEEERGVEKCENERSDESDTTEDLNIQNNEMPAFVKQLYKKTMDKVNAVQKKQKQKKTLENKEDVVTKKIHQHLMAELKNVSDCLAKASEVFLAGEKKKAIVCFNRAIELEPRNFGHYLNRSYCYLRIGDNFQAICSAREVIERSNNIVHIAIAKFYMGQAHYGMQNYEMAEQYYEEALKMCPNDKCIQRELLFIKMKQLVNMGFQERQVLKVLRDYPVITDACSILTDQTLKNDNVDDKEEEKVENEIFCSDDEDNPSSATLLTDLVNHYLQKNNKTAKSELNESSFTYKHNNTNYTSQITTGMMKSIVHDSSKKIINHAKNHIVNSKTVDDKVLWVGKIVPAVTDNLIRKKFSRFGKIVSIVRPTGNSYAFVNFESSISVSDALSTMENCEINGYKVLVRAKPKKYP